MSLELAIQENTAAVKALIDVWAKLVTQGNTVAANAAAKTAAGEPYGVTAGGTPVTKVEPKAEAPKAEAPKGKAAAPAPTPAASEPAPAATAASETAAESPSDEVVDMVLLTKETTAAATRNRAGLVALLAEYGAARASAIPQGDWPAYIAKVRAL